jgi:hypothetical protein
LIPSDLVLEEKHICNPILDLIHAVAVRALHLTIDDLPSDKEQVKVLEEIFVVLLVLCDLFGQGDTPLRELGYCGF